MSCPIESSKWASRATARGMAEPLLSDLADAEPHRDSIRQHQPGAVIERSLAIWDLPPHCAARIRTEHGVTDIMLLIDGEYLSAYGRYTTLLDAIAGLGQVRRTGGSAMNIGNGDSVAERCARVSELMRRALTADGMATTIGSIAELRRIVDALGPPVRWPSGEPIPRGVTDPADAR